MNLSIFGGPSSISWTLSMAFANTSFSELSNDSASAHRVKIVAESKSAESRDMDPRNPLY